MQRRGGAIGLRIILALLAAGFALFQYLGSSQVNPVTGQKQHVNISPQQEIALGLQAAPEMEQQYGGESSNAAGQQLVSDIGNQIVQSSDAGQSPYKFQFHLLADPQTINAFALPGGQVFVTTGLVRHLKTKGQMAGVLGHEIGHVIARHSAQQLAKQQLTQGLTGAAVLATYDPNNGNSRASAGVLAAIGQLVTMKYGRNDELEADKFGVKLMSEAGYDPRAMITVMQILKESAGGQKQPEFFSTHPDPDNRIEHIKTAIQAVYPNGVPTGMKS